MRKVWIMVGLAIPSIMMMLGGGKHGPQQVSAFCKGLDVTNCRVQDGMICGTAVNNTGGTLTYAEVDFKLYDASGAKIGTAVANTTKIEPGGSWPFEAYVSESNVARAELASTKAY